MVVVLLPWRRRRSRACVCECMAVVVVIVQGKFRSDPIAASVGDIKPTAWASLFMDLHILLLVFPAGVIAVVRRCVYACMARARVYAVCVFSVCVWCLRVCVCVCVRARARARTRACRCVRVLCCKCRPDMARCTIR